LGYIILTEQEGYIDTRKQILKKYRQKNKHNTKSLMAFLQRR